MRTFISLVMVLLPCLAFAATDCRIVEYPDHVEAVCVGDPLPTPASSGMPEQEQAPVQQALVQEHALEQEPALASAQAPDQTDFASEHIVRNDLARLHAVSWLARR